MRRLNGNITQLKLLIVLKLDNNCDTKYTVRHETNVHYNAEMCQLTYAYQTMQNEETEHR